MGSQGGERGDRAKLEARMPTARKGLSSFLGLGQPQEVGQGGRGVTVRVSLMLLGRKMPGRTGLRTLILVAGCTTRICLFLLMIVVLDCARGLVLSLSCLEDIVNVLLRRLLECRLAPNARVAAAFEIRRCYSSYSTKT